jgi:hypothetical protein
MSIRREDRLLGSYVERMWRSRCGDCGYTYRCIASGPVFAWSRRHLAHHRVEASR